MKFLLTAKNWQLFIIWLILIFGTGISIGDYPTLAYSLRLISLVLMILWPILVVHELQNYLPKRIEMNYTFFMINGAIVILGFIGNSILKEGKTFYVEGLEALPMLYIFFALFYVYSFPGRTIRTIENNKEASISESLGDFILVVFFPIGIWFLQNRINKIVEKTHKMDQNQES